MKIRTRLRLFAALPAAIILAIAAVLGLTNDRIEDTRRQSNAAHEMIQAHNDLNILLHEYLLYREDRAAVQWRRRHASLGRLIAQIEANSPGEAGLLREIGQDYKEAARLFDRVVASPPAASIVDWRQRMVSQLVIRTESMRSRAQQLAESRDRQAVALERQTEMAVLGLLVALTLLSAAISIALVRTLNRSIGTLAEGASRIRAGDLSQEIAVASADEFGELGRAFDDMRQEIARHRENLEALVLKRTAELEQANDRLRELDRLKSMFIASMSHELRTPLNSIIGFTGIMLQGLAGPIAQEQRKQLGVVKKNANHLLSLINDIIDVSKIEAGNIDLAVADFDLAALIREVADSFSRAAQDKGVALHVIAPETLPFRSDRRRVKQIVMNLVDNGLKFTDRGHVAVEVSCRGDLVDIAVRDTGIGIPAEAMSDLFVAFSQIATPDKAREGSGLGLYLSQRIAALLGGLISVRSEPGKGSVFTFSMRNHPPIAACRVTPA